MQSSREAIAEYLLEVSIEAWVKSGFFAVITLAEFSSNEVVFSEVDMDPDGGIARSWPLEHESFLVGLMNRGRI